MFENHRNVSLNIAFTFPLKMANKANFWKPKTCCQTVLPDRLILLEQKLVENAKNFVAWYAV